MKIVGFGDSFILKSSQYHITESYESCLIDRYNCVTEFRGVPGTGPWNMFFDFLNYPDKDKVDVIILAWSEIIRLYHPKYSPLNTHTILDTKTSGDEEYMATINAGKKYYSYLMHQQQKDHELSALMLLVDEMSKNHPNIKFIHLPCFSKYDTNSSWMSWYDKAKPEDIEYFHRFKHGAEIRPCLAYLSKKDGWPGNIANDFNRPCHMTPRMNKIVADAIIECIDNYHPGKLIEMNIEQ